jgi:hypothetical protein
MTSTRSTLKKSGNDSLTPLSHQPSAWAHGVPLEAAHQRDRWGSEHDAGKSPFDWFWLVGYLAQKAAASAVAGDADKAMHHTISTAGALANWHAQLSGKTNVMRPGIGPGNGGEKPGSAFDLASRATLNTLTQGEGQ